jgi:sigma-B regulation protein RsbQ
MECSDAMAVVRRNNVRILGHGRQSMVFAHGFGCDQNMWRLVTPAFAEDYRIVLFDHVGAGHSDASQFDPAKYGTLHGYAQDLVEICHAADVSNGIFVGHSVSAIIGVLASIKAPSLFERLVLVAPSPGYINDGNYIGGFGRTDIEELLDFLDSNYLGWSSAMAPVIMGNPAQPELAGELENSFCRTDPEIARHFARVTFMSDHRGDLPETKVPSLILQCAEDVIAPQSVGEFMQRQMPDSSLYLMHATGHCPNLSAPEETIAAIKQYLQSPVVDDSKRA